MQSIRNHSYSGGMIMKLSTLVSFLLLTSSLATLCSANDPIEESRNAASDGRVTIENLSGTVVVEGWDKDEVTVTGTLAADAEGFDFGGTESRTTMEVVFPRRSRNLDDTDSDLKVRVPRDSQVFVSGVNIEIDLSGVNGRVRLESVNGRLTIVGSPRSIEAETVNGDIEIDAETDEVNAESVSGDVSLHQTSGLVEVATVTGNIDVAGGEFEDGEFTSVSGDILFEGSPTSDGELEFESHSGSARLILPEDLSAEYEVSTFSGDIDNDFGPRPRKTSKYTPGQELEFTVGSGEASVSITSFSGTVHLEYK